ncbi:uncharacterized protein LOC120072063 [Benincasa hispida]|uniref:uncharacterized protein LOC120072063 n=1 Tax=Benincasa hispida TaxID=102211 RepID=UPI0019016F00|nr:uncharacterized protein LOC120072063 [Benincasa hispida]
MANNNERPDGNQGVNWPVQDPVFLAADRNIPMRNYAAPNLYNFSPEISRPTVAENASNTYNPGWRNHPTFSWGGNHNQRGQSNHQNSHPGNRVNPPVFLSQNHSQAPKTQQAKDLNEQPIEQEVRRDPPPFSSRLKKKDDNKQFKRFLDVLRQLHINIPLVEALEQMPSYVKFLKDILVNKRKIEENETIALTYECSALFQNHIPTKMKDPGSFTLPCSIGGKEVRNALCDLGANINLMPLSIFKNLNIGNARPTTVTLQLADRSITHPEGKIEDVLVQVDKFIFPTDFIILDYEADIEVPIILGRPFLATGRALIDVHKGELTIRVDDQQVKFNVLNALKYPGDMENCQYVGELQEEHWHESKKELKEEDFGIGTMWEENCATIQIESDFETIKLSE